MKCEICGRDFKGIRGLSTHIGLFHNILSKNYYDCFLKKENAGICYCKKDTSFRNMVYGYNQYCSIKCQINSSLVRGKINEIFQTKYGGHSPQCSCEIQQKTRQKYKKKTGYDNPSQNPTVQKTKRLNYKKKTGYTHYAKTPRGRENSRRNYIRMVENQKLNGEPLCPRIGDKERICLNELEKMLKIKFLRNPHCFASTIARFPDGYNSYLKLVILFHERIHYFDKECTIETGDTVQTTKDYESIGLTVFKISEKQWKENKEVVIFDLKKLINLLSEQIQKEPLNE